MAAERPTMGPTAIAALQSKGASAASLRGSINRNATTAMAKRASASIAALAAAPRHR